MNWYLAVLSKYATFEGRARRTEYWMFALFNIIISVVLEVLYVATSRSSLFLILSVLYGLGVLLPSLAVFCRRMHDQDKSGWWWLIALIPFIGGIWLLILTCLPGTAGPNKYGPDPKAIGA
jgi:uncharacterized membrane protein YhaH (DUF805 family)